jgi:hypothetical protein
MEQDYIELFNYKGVDVIARPKGKKYQIGIRGDNKIAIWFESVSYDNTKLLISSGREYARIMIDKMLLARKKGVRR